MKILLHITRDNSLESKKHKLKQNQYYMYMYRLLYVMYRHMYTGLYVHV